ncbi:probable serine/threonine-protein kinase nek3 [Mycetomoellerius zeteki]|uniref:probable serine/threonine-protein kinase nek3 n=1 Tax=Mycetomoellerius zeteki TaxID=64791 RepID=UPI00084E4EE5|nr:PREDICTED: probable serine/threonine-protein kinase nek3 [Trachymyrmex zeteki]
MRMQLLKIVVVLLVAGSGDTRPQNGADSQAKTIERNDAGWRGIQVSSKSHDIVRDDSSGQVNDTHRDLKDLQYMDQSLRTVATQLLNVTNPQDMVNVNNKELIKAEHNVATTPKSSENSVPLLMRDVSSEINLEPVHFGRPINSKFSYFESSHPGQAMAMTEEELEREISTTRLITAYKNHPTTTGGISTWILLNPPSTTVKSVEIEKSKTQQPFQTEVRLTVRPSSSIEKETIPQPEKITEKTTPQLTPVITTEKVTVITKKPSMTTTKKIVTTSKPEKVTQNSEKTESSSSTTLKVIRTTTTSTSTTSDGTATLTAVLTTKKSQSPRTTSKPKVTTSRTTLHSKPATTKPASIKPTTMKPVRPKPTRKSTVKPETIKNDTSTSTGKIEKVTFKPVSVITTPQDKLENTEKPMFVTKIKASVLMDTQKTPTTLLPATTATTLSASTTFKSNFSTVDLVEVPVKSKPVNTKGNNVLKVQLKKPIDETTQIEIQPIKVNAPILTIEKIDKMDEIMMKDMDDLNDSRIDLKFDFNPELTKINVETKAEADAMTSTSATASTTTKRPRHNSKRKKNKTRRRKPTTTSPSSTMVPVLMETNESVTDSTITDNAVQESKIAPETKVGANTTKTKKKQPQKAISTQIYNFLSREVMPSFGVMSLVGLGLGLASYFLYPFGGTITRRNYDVEPNYKYNMDEYGGNYGQSEEEMLSKVYQGMTNYENKYPGTKDNYNSNYYQYQHYDGAYDTQTKKIETRYPSVTTSPVYKAVENTQPAVKYRNTDFQYPEAQTTPVYYDRKRLDFATEVGTSSAANRQFVVGNVPKEYPFDVKAANLPVDNKKGYMSTEVGQTQFEREVTQDFDFPNAAGLNSYGHLGASTIRADDGYEEIEITPTAVAVEHGPRSLKVKRAALNEGGRGRRSRSKRESVIQIIPTKRELEEEREEAEKEEDLNNEILDIIDSALPGGEVPHKTKGSNENEVEDLEGQKRKQQEEANTRAKESTLKTTHTEDTTEIPASTTVGKIDDGGTSVSSEKSSDTTHPADSKDPETIEWFDSSTTKKPSEGFSLINFVKKVAEIKFRLGLTILKHASEGFARYLGHVQKRINGEE